MFNDIQCIETVVLLLEFLKVFILSIETIYHVDNISTICKYNTFFSQSFVFVSAEWITVRHCLMQKAEEINTFSWKHNDRKQRLVIKKLQTETASLYLYFLIMCAQYKQWLLRHFPPKKTVVRIWNTFCFVIQNYCLYDTFGFDNRLLCS